MKELLRMKSRSPLVFWSLACTLLASCGGHILQGPDGTLQLKMQWPTAGFSTQVIPADTDRIELRIMASGEPPSVPLCNGSRAKRKPAGNSLFPPVKSA
jgi:hypothetical protein